MAVTRSDTPRQYSLDALIRSAYEDFSVTIRTSGGTADAAFEGDLQAVEIAPGLIASGHRITYLEDRRVEMNVQPSITLGLLLDGDVQPLDIPGHASIRQARNVPMLFGFGASGVCATTWRRGHHCAVAGFSLRPAFFDRFDTGLDDAQLDPLYRLFRTDHVATTLQRSPRLAQLGEASLAGGYHGALGMLHRESTAIAMLVEVAQLLSATTRANTRLPGHHRRILRDACERIDADLAASPSVTRLARDVATNVTTLQRIFRAALGTTVFGYLQGRRLEVARILLRERAGHVSDIAHRVGFASPAAFAAAYRRRFGQTPSAAYRIRREA